MKQPVRVRKRDGRMEQFSYGKLASSIARAIGKRPDRHRVDRIVRRALFGVHVARPVPTDFLSERALFALRELGEIPAYIRYRLVRDRVRGCAELEEWFRRIKEELELTESTNVRSIG